MTCPVPFGLSFLAYPVPARAADQSREMSEPDRRTPDPTSSGGPSAGGRRNPSDPRSDDDDSQ
jgi:hypothetical protein